MTIPSIQSLMKKYGIVAKKRYGQHFLSAMPTIRKIVDALKIEDGGLVLEIGPGLGVMTAVAAERGVRIVAIDKDIDALNIAQEEFGDRKMIKWIHGDILEFDPGSICAAGQKIKILGNLPYNISTPILFWMIANRARISRAAVMVQKEVALRIAAKHGNKDYGIPSVLIQACSECSRLFDISAASFIPPPKVVSSLVSIDFEKEPYSLDDFGHLASIVKLAFGKRRKTLRNNLLSCGRLSPEIVDTALESLSIDGRRRPEELSVGEFIALAAKFAK